MKTILCLAASVLCCIQHASALDLVPDAVMGTPVTERQDHPRVHVEFVEWAGDKLVCAGGEGFVRCYEPEARKRLWFAALDAPVRSLAVSQTAQKVFVPQEDLAGNRVKEPLTVFDLADGKTRTKYTAEELAKRADRRSISLTSLACIPATGRLMIGGFDGLVVFDPETKNRECLEMDDKIAELTSDRGGRFVAANSYRNNVHVWDLQTKQEIAKVGLDHEIEIDGTNLRGSAFDGDRTLVFASDGWRSSDVIVYDVKAKTVLADFQSTGGDSMDADFVRGRIAVGSNRDLILYDMTGKLLAERKDAASQSIAAVKFSFDGKRLAIGSRDNTTRVFLLRDE